MVAVVGVVLLLVGVDLLLQIEGNAFLGIPYPPESLDRYWEALPTLGWGLIIAGVALLVTSVLMFWKGGTAEATPINIPSTPSQAPGGLPTSFS